MAIVSATSTSIKDVPVPVPVPKMHIIDLEVSPAPIPLSFCLVISTSFLLINLSAVLLAMTLHARHEYFRLKSLLAYFPENSFYIIFGIALYKMALNLDEVPMLPYLCIVAAHFLRIVTPRYALLVLNPEEVAHYEWNPGEVVRHAGGEDTPRRALSRTISTSYRSPRVRLFSCLLATWLLLVITFWA
jgi:hypothetical protein